MDRIFLRRMDDSHRVTIDSTGEVPSAIGLEESAYEAGFRRVVAEAELAPGRARIFETGGSFILVVRDSEGIRAFDAQPLIQSQRVPHLLHAQRFVIEASGSPGEPIPLRPLPAVVQESWIWVDAEAARS